MAMKKSIPMSDQVRSAIDLIHLAEVDFLVCKKIYEKITTQKKRKGGDNFLLLSANNAFNEAVGILHTLLCSTQKEDLKLKPILEAIVSKDKSSGIVDNKKTDHFLRKLRKDYPDIDYSRYTFLLVGDARLIGDIIAEIRKKNRFENALNDFDDIKEKFEEHHFHRMRHQLVAHKNVLLPDPAAAAKRYLKDDVIDKLGDIIKDLRINSSLWFNYAMGNYLRQTIVELDSFLADY